MQLLTVVQTQLAEYRRGGAGRFTFSTSSGRLDDMRRQVRRETHYGRNVDPPQDSGC